jgi:hypothetical protein
MADATLKNVMAYFGIPTGIFSREWKELTDADKQQIKAGIGNGTETY